MSLPTGSMRSSTELQGTRHKAQDARGSNPPPAITPRCGSPFTPLSCDVTLGACTCCFCRSYDCHENRHEFARFRIDRFQTHVVANLRRLKKFQPVSAFFELLKRSF